jgi:hypothetical protein
MTNTANIVISLLAASHNSMVALAIPTSPCLAVTSVTPATALVGLACLVLGHCVPTHVYTPSFSSASLDRHNLVCLGRPTLDSRWMFPPPSVEPLVPADASRTPFPAPPPAVTLSYAIIMPSPPSRHVALSKCPPDAM